MDVVGLLDDSVVLLLVLGILFGWDDIISIGVLFGERVLGLEGVVVLVFCSLMGLVVFVGVGVSVGI